MPLCHAFTGGPIQDHLVLKYNGTAAEFAAAAALCAPQTRVRVLEPGEPLVIQAEVDPIAETATDAHSHARA